MCGCARFCTTVFPPLFLQEIKVKIILVCKELTHANNYFFAKLNTNLINANKNHGKFKKILLTVLEF